MRQTIFFVKSHLCSFPEVYHFLLDQHPNHPAFFYVQTTSTHAHEILSMKCNLHTNENRTLAIYSQLSMKILLLLFILSKKQ